MFYKRVDKRSRMGILFSTNLFYFSLGKEDELFTSKITPSGLKIQTFGMNTPNGGT